jgi:hypothetical protein
VRLWLEIAFVLAFFGFVAWFGLHWQFPEPPF